MPEKDINKDIKLINKDFVSLRNALIDFTKAYFPDTYTDFSQASLGMMQLEQTAYVGDVLSYYIDNNVKESILDLAEEQRNVINLASWTGYKYKSSYPAYAYLDVYQVIPSKDDGQNIDLTYALNIDAGMIVQSSINSNINFRTLDPVDFSLYETSPNDFFHTIYESDANGKPTFYLLKKTIRAIAGNIKSQTFSFGSPEKYSSITLPETDIIEIIDVTDSDGNKWYEVDYLAQDIILTDVENNDYTNNQNSSERQEAPYILKMKRVAKRFVKKMNDKGQTTLQFGAGISAYPDQILIPTPETIKYNTSFSNFMDQRQKFMQTTTYGVAPSNTVLTVRYATGGGVQSNASEGELTIIRNVVHRKDITSFNDDVSRNIFNICKASLAVNNSIPATGGRDGDSINEIRENAKAFFFAQDRCLNEKDYLIRSLSMPSKYGSVPKIYVEKDTENKSVLNIYTLSYDKNKNLISLNDTVKQNLITYLNYYRGLLDAINIKDAYIINIGINFELITFSNYNKNEVMIKCIQRLKNYFNIDNFQIGTPIIIRDIYEVLDRIEGVRTISNLEIYNIYDSEKGYSNNYYHIPSATRNGIIYTSKDPSIFEVKFPDRDIKGR